MMFERRRRTFPKVTLIPMVDVISFLLVFFMLFTTFKTREAGLNIDLPKAASAQASEVTPIVITINQAGSMFYDGKLVSESMLKEYISPILKEDPLTPVVVKADKRTSYEHVVDAIDAVRLSGGAKLHLGVQVEIN